MKILLTGGGTLGSVTPLLAIAEHLKEASFIFIGTKNGPEGELIRKKGLRFIPIISGKWRRYFSFKNIIDLIKIKVAFWQSLFLLSKEKPDVIISIGGFVAVPIIWAGWFLRIPIYVHSQDIKTGLSISLTKPFATKLTKAFPNTSLKAEVVGNPVRNLTITTNILKLKQDKPTVLITGGGTGALFLNLLISEEILKHAQIVHLLGKDKSNKVIDHPDYHAFEFLEEAMIEALNKADIVITRAGIGTLTELAVLGKPTIIIPIPDSHQELNAKYLANQQAAVYLKQNDLTKEKLAKAVIDLLMDKAKQRQLSENIKKIIPENSNEKISDIIKKLAQRL